MSKIDQDRNQGDGVERVETPHGPAMRRPTSLSEMLLIEFMEPHELSREDLAELLQVERREVSKLLKGGRLSPSMAIRLSRLFGTTPHFWLNIQAKMDKWNEALEVINLQIKNSSSYGQIIPIQSKG